MKKTYIKPSVKAVSLFAEGEILANSIKVDPSESTDKAFAGKGGWNADDWSGTDEEE